MVRVRQTEKDGTTCVASVRAARGAVRFTTCTVAAGMHNVTKEAARSDGSRGRPTGGGRPSIGLQAAAAGRTKG